jgi:6-phosphogluconolactonase
MSGYASKAHFHSMVIDPLNYSENLELALIENEVFKNTDVIILGMGDDGHTASLFPNEEQSDAASISQELMANTTSPNEPSKRITFCGPILQSGKHIFLMITGPKKLDVLSKSLEKNYPIQQFIPFIEGIYFTENA